MRPGVLHVVVCGAPPARDVGVLVTEGRRRGWDVCVVATPSALGWVDVTALETATGHPVRSEYKRPGTVDLLPAPDAIAVAPATVNTLSKWSLAVCDTLATGLLVEAIGKGLPLVALPFTNRAHAAHPAVAEHVRRLRSWGVRVLLGDDVHPLHDPGTGGRHVHAYPWHLVLDTLAEMPYAAGRGRRETGHAL